MSCSKEIAQLDLPQLEPIFKKLLDIATKVTDSRTKLHSLYCEWSEISKETVDSLFKIREKILQHNLNSNIASLTGVSTSIVGSICAIIGVAFTIPTAGLSLALTAGGAAAAVAGGGVSMGSKITKNVLSSQLCEKARRVLSENITLTEALEKERQTYFDLLNQFKNHLEDLQSVDVLEALAHLSGTEDIFSRDLELEDDIRNSLPPSSIQMTAMQPEENSILKTIKEYVLKLIKLIMDDKYLLQLWEYFEEFKKLKPIKYLRSGLRPAIATEGGANIVRIAGTLKGAFAKMSTASRVAVGAANGIFVILGIVDLVMTSIDVHNGSVSSETEELLKSAEDLKVYREDVVEIVANTFGWHI